ncbi:uncharacterized protein LOC119515707 [Choloepus didactylus]|uniref:uncharacterized protein LOC119515707 n=1 Tax=Choloepus didactylus TaxID=27675 RepID=UPI00189D17E1|nr:uncharacterized protein LOC119515707 [Choloepus didactylus]
MTQGGCRGLGVASFPLGSLHCLCSPKAQVDGREQVPQLTTGHYLEQVGARLEEWDGDKDDASHPGRDHSTSLRGPDRVPQRDPEGMGQRNGRTILAHRPFHLEFPSHSSLTNLSCPTLRGTCPSQRLWLGQPPDPRISWAELWPDEGCAEAQDGELDGLWTTISIFITLFLLSVCYSATVTLFKVKWIFSSVVELKQTIIPDYRNMIGQGA